MRRLTTLLMTAAFSLGLSGIAAAHPARPEIAANEQIRGAEAKADVLGRLAENLERHRAALEAALENVENETARAAITRALERRHGLEKAMERIALRLEDGSEDVELEDEDELEDEELDEDDEEDDDSDEEDEDQGFRGRRPVTPPAGAGRP